MFVETKENTAIISKSLGDGIDRQSGSLQFL
jgi:hypothetical protein